MLAKVWDNPEALCRGLFYRESMIGKLLKKLRRHSLCAVYNGLLDIAM